MNSRMKNYPMLLLVGLLATGRIEAAPSEALRAAIALYDANKLVDAKQAFEKFSTAASSEAAEVNYYLGAIAYRQKSPEAAVEFMKKAADLAPKDARVQR